MDVSNHENLVVYVKLLNEFKPELHFLENMNVRDERSKLLQLLNINLLMERRNLHKDKMAGLGSDGASVMTGKNNGILKRVKDTQAKRLIVFLIWQNSKGSLLVFTAILTSLPSSHSHW